jgi:protein-tyrosine sulfotransferase
MSLNHSATSRPIIIAGVHRSGTSLLRRLLNANPRVFCPAEIKFHKDLLGQFRDDPLAHARLGRSLAALGLPPEYWLDAFGRTLVELYEEAARRAGKIRWADKNPENCINIRHWHRLLAGNLSFVLIVRNPLDTFASMNEASMNLTYGVTRQERTRHIEDYLAQALTYVEARRSHCQVIEYEGLATTPLATMKNLMSGLDESYDAALLERALLSSPGVGLEDPKITLKNSVHSDSVGRWRSDLKAADIEFVTSRLSHLGKRIHAVAGIEWEGFR